MAVTAVGGTALFRINGTQYQMRGSMKIMPLSKERTPGVNADGSFYFTEKHVPATVDIEVSDSGGLSVQSFQGFTNEYVTLELVNGKVYALSEAVFTGAADLDAVEGKFTAKFAGLCTEIT